MNRTKSPPAQSQNDGPTQVPADYESRKRDLELEKLALENKTLALKLQGKEIPSRWEIIRTSITWIGIVIPVMISVFTYLHQRGIELEQRAVEAHDRRLAEIKSVTDLIEQGDRSAGVLRLSAYGEDALPMIIGEVRIKNFHIDWPSTTLAAISAIERVGVNKLSTHDLAFLKDQGGLSVSELESAAVYLQNLKGKDDEKSLIIKNRLQQDGAAQIKIIEALQRIVGPAPDWKQAIDRYWSQSD